MTERELRQSDRGRHGVMLRCVPAKTLAILVSALVFGVGGQLASAGEGETQLGGPNTQARVAVLREQALARPHDFAVLRRFGAALLESGDATAALEPLRTAHQQAPRDALALYLLGRAADQGGDHELAIRVYGEYLADRADARTALVRKRMEELSLASARAWYRQARDRESTLLTQEIMANSITVPDLATPVVNDTLRILSRGVALLFVTDLSQVLGVQVLERQRMHVLAEELQRPGAKFGPAPKSAPPLIVTADNAHRVGRLLRSQRVAQGALAPLSHEGLQLSMVVFDTQSQSVAATATPAIGRIPEVMSMEKEVLVSVLSQLKLPVAPALRRRLRHPATRKFDAFLSFCRGVEAEDLGRGAEALDAYDQALRLDPSFQLARQRQQTLSVTSEAVGALDQAAWTETAVVEPADDRAGRSLDELGIGPHASAINPRLPAASKVGTHAVVIRGRLP